MMAMCREKVLSAKDLSLNYERASDFVSCSIRGSSLWYAILVTCLSIYSVTMSVYTGLTSDYGLKIFIWLTYWSYFALTGRFIVSAFNAWRFIVKQKLSGAGRLCADTTRDELSGAGTLCADTTRDELSRAGRLCADTTRGELSRAGRLCSDTTRDELSGAGTLCADTTRDDITAAGNDCYDETRPSARDMPVLYKVQWVLQNISGTSALLVTGLYWTIMFDHNKVETVRSINSHIVNSLTVLTDVCLSRAPVRIHHCLHGLVFVTSYILFTAVYWAAGGLNHQGEDYIYPLLNYSKSPGRAVLVYLGVALLVTPCLQAMLYTVYRLREGILARCPDTVTTQRVVTDRMSSTVKSSLPSVKTDGISASSDLKDIFIRPSTKADKVHMQDIQIKVLTRPLLKSETS